MHNLIMWIDAFFLTYFLLLNNFYTLLTILTIFALHRRNKEYNCEDLNQLMRFDIEPPAVTIIMAAYNEQKVILESVQAALNVEFAYINIIVVNDGSTDQTLQTLIDHYQLTPVPPAIPAHLKTAPVKQLYRSKLYPNFMVVDKENGGREDANNAGVNACATPYFVGVDADSFIEPDALSRFMQHLLTIKDTCAMGGALRIVNGCVIKNGRIEQVHFPKSWFGKMQIIEYMRRV